MVTLKQVIFAGVLVSALLSMAAAQDSPRATAQNSSLTITAAASGERVRITAPSAVVQMRVEVYAPNGEKLFDQEIRGGNVFDWHLQDGQAQRLAAGTYVCVVTTRTISGKLTRKMGAVQIGENSVSVQPADSQQLSTQQAQTIGPVEEDPSWTIPAKDEQQTTTVAAHDGTDGQMIRGRGALSFRIGDFFSGTDQEQMRLTAEGNLGIGTSQPKAMLDVAGTIRAQRVLIAKPASYSRTAADDNTQAANFPDSAQPLASGSGTKDQIAKWTDNAGTLGDSSLINTGGNVGLGVTSPGDLLDIAGAPNASGRSGITVRTTASSGNATLYFDGDRGNFAAYGGLLTGGSTNPFTFFGVTRADKTFLIADGASSLGLGVGTLVPKPVIFGTNNAERMRIDSSGNVGIGTTVPAVQLDVQKQNPSLDTAFQVTSLNSDNVWLGRAATTLQSGTQTISGQSLMFLGGAGHNGTGFTSARAGIDIQASQNWTGSANGTRMRFITANNGSTTGSERMRIEPDGDIGIGTTAPLRHLHVKGAGDQEIGIESTDALGQQWTLQSSAGASFGRFEIINRTAGANRFTISSSGLVGIGTSSPNVKLDVRGDMNVTGNASAGEVALISNQANTDDADLLRLAITGSSSDLTTTNNFITFSHVNNSLGAIQPNGSGGIELISGSADYAEWLPRINPTEEIQPGEIVGLHGGRVSKKTRGATQVMAVSTGAIVAGNDPGEKARKGSELVAFIGQVMVRVRGTVKSGDFIVASGLDDGTGIAVLPERITAEQFEQVVGQAWETSADAGVKPVRVAVGLMRHDPTVKRLLTHSQQQAAQLAAMEARLETLQQKIEQNAALETRVAAIEQTLQQLPVQPGQAQPGKRQQ